MKVVKCICTELYCNWAYKGEVCHDTKPQYPRSQGLVSYDQRAPAKCPDERVGWDCSNENQMQSTCLQKCTDENRYATKKCICRISSWIGCDSIKSENWLCAPDYYNLSRVKNFGRDGQCLWKHKGRDCLKDEFGSGGGFHGGHTGGDGSNFGDSNDQNNETENNNFHSGTQPDKDFYRDFQKMLTQTMDISIARSTINLYL